MTLSESAPDSPRASQRLFVALWPDDSVRPRLAAVAGALRLSGGRLVPPQNLHVTLAFLGASDAERRGCIEQKLSGVVASGFELAFGVLRYRRRSAMVWLEAHDVPPALHRLVTAINRKLADCGHSAEPRSFRAHVTLARNVRGLGPRPADIDVVWQVGDCCLVSSRPAPEGSAYTVLRRWPFAG